MKKIEQVAILIPTLLKGGAEKQSVLLANVLSKNYDVSLIVLKGGSIESSLFEILDQDKVEVFKLNKGFIGSAIEIYRIFKRKKIDITFSYLASGNFLNGVIGKLSQVPNRIGGIRNAQLSKKKLPFERFFHNKLLTKTISNSHSAVLKLTQKGFKENKFHVIHNVFDLKQPPIERNAEKNINIVSVARFVPQKDYFTAIDAIKLTVDLLKNSENTFRYFIVGYGDQEKEIRDRIRELQMEEYIKIVINPNNLFDYFEKGDIFLTTSLHEGMSNSVMEAMSYSLPIVTTNAGDTEYLVKDHYNGFICPYKESETFSKKLKELISNYNLRIQMGLKSYSTLKNNFSMEGFSNNYLSFINSFSNQNEDLNEKS